MFYPPFKILNFEKIFIFFLLYTNKLIMASISLEASLRTCKVDTGWANKVESDRFLNPNLMVCPIWNGRDTSGRQVCPDSFMTKRAGCNSPEDRVVVENNVSRPQYMEYINLNANGVQGDIYGNTMGYQETGVRDQMLDNTGNVTGQFGLQTGFGQNVLQNCGTSCKGESCSWNGLRNNTPPQWSRTPSIANQARLNREGQFLNQGMGAQAMRVASGM